MSSYIFRNRTFAVRVISLESVSLRLARKGLVGALSPWAVTAGGAVDSEKGRHRPVAEVSLFLTIHLFGRRRRGTCEGAA